MSACGGARGIRTPDLLIANETRYQLRHSPKDSNSLAPSQSAVQADHCRVRHDTERQRKRATRRQRNLDECVTGALHIGRHNSDSLNTRAAQPAQQHPHATAPRARRPAARHHNDSFTTGRVARPGRHPGPGRRPDRRRPRRWSGRPPGRSVRSGAPGLRR